MKPIIGELKEIKENMEVKWKISDFYSLPENADSSYRSPEFYFAGALWYLWFFPYGQKSNDTVGSIGCYLVMSNSTRPVNLVVELGLQDRDHALIKDCSYTRTFDANTGIWGCKNFITKLKLIERKNYYTPNDVLTFTCNMTEKNSIIPSSPCRKTKKLSEDLRELMLNGNGSDLTIKVKEKEFKLHKIILGIRAPDFATMVKKEVEKNLVDIVEVNDWEEVPFTMFLEYVYAGRVDENLLKKNFLNLYKIAKMYNSSELKEECLKCVRDTLTIATFFDAVEIAEKYDEKELELLISRFCSDNLKDLVKDPKWLKFMHENTEKAYELLSTAIASYVKSKTV